mgnify:CR=1 FL=1
MTFLHSNVTAADLPESSLLHARIGPGDFLDCFKVRSDMAPRPAADIITAFPGWAQFLLKIRRVVTAPFGLSNDGPDADDKVGIFPVEVETGSELVAGFNDLHLDFRVSVLSEVADHDRQERDQDLLRLYELWLTTRSPHAAKRLARLGLPLLGGGHA